jgi:MSHA biogenesis protein MshI
LKRVNQEYKLDTNHVTYLLENKECDHVQIEKPSVPDNELKEAARWAMKDSISTPVEDITLDVVSIPKGQNGEIENHDFLYVIYADNKRIAEISNTLLSAKLNLKSIDTRIMAQRNIANELSQPEQGEALLSFTSNGALITFTHNGELCNARFIEISEDHSDTSFEKISLEIQRSLDGFESNFRNIFIKKLMVAPFDLREPFCEHLRESIYTKVETFELEDIFDFSEGVELGNMSRQASFLPVLGAALRLEVAT